jgi:DNA (cytosine-5)-methyltransferase 1
MRELSLFSGAGGGLLGTHLLGWRPVGYVEWDDYCQRIIAARIRDGYLPDAPIFGDIRAFNRDGYAEAYSGLVDVVTAGFPCQPFSSAGKQLGEDDPRNMWPATIATIRVVRPPFIFLENVPRLLSSGYFGTILGELAESGYDARWRVLSAAEVGAPHQRDRLWVVGQAQDVAYPHRSRWGENELDLRQGKPNSVGSRPHVAHSNRQRAVEQEGREREQRGWTGDGSKALAHTERTGSQGSARARMEQSEQLAGRGWWLSEPRLGRVAHGVADRVDRLEAIGNGQVPAVVTTAWRLLTGDC